MMNLISICKNAQTIGISGHIRPDGDCVASTTALWQFLKKVFPKKRIDVRIEKPQDIYNSLYGVSQIVYDEADVIYDVFFVCDSVPDRIGNAYKFYESAKERYNIDHHISNTAVGEQCYIVPEASSASELVYDLIKEADPNGNYMDEELAKTIYVGIIQDCGVFQYSNTSPKTLCIAADLISYGFDFPRLIDETFHEKTYVQNQVLGYAIEKSGICLDGRLIYSVLSRAEMERLGAGSKDFDGIVNQLRYTKGVYVAAFLHENEDGNYKVSLRSSGEIDVSRLAMAFGGGGHVRAAGCLLSGSKEAMIEKLTKEMKKQLAGDNHV